MTDKGDAVTSYNWNLVKDADETKLGELGSSSPNPDIAQAVNVAFQRLQPLAAKEAAEAQKSAAQAQQSVAADSARAAKAAEDTAKHTKSSARWIMLSVIVLAVASLLNLVVEIFKHP
jgi:hypothetical protein